MSSRFTLMADPQFGIFEFNAAKAEVEASGRSASSVAAQDWPELTNWEQEERLFQAAVSQANNAKPDFVVICGDMVMQWDSAAQAEAVKRVARGLGSSIPLHWAPGNHDVGADFFAPTPETLARYRETFGADYYSFEHGRDKFIVINSPLFDRPELAPGEYGRQLEWLHGELRQPHGSGKTIVFSHHPPFLESPDEEHGTYNLPLDSRKALLELLQEGGVSALFAGHTHLNVLARHGDMEIVASGSTGYNRAGGFPGYRVVNVTADAIEHSYHHTEDE